MLDLSFAKVDLDKLDKGCWWQLRMEDRQIVGEPVETPDEDQPAVLLVPIGMGYDRALKREQEPYLDQLRRDDLPDDVRDALYLKTAGRAAAIKVVRGWQNLSFDGKQIPWSESAAADLLASREWQNLLRFCIDAASHRQAALAKSEAESAKN